MNRDRSGASDEPTEYRFWVGIVVFVASFFVLGGEFWDKVRALFIHTPG